MTERTGIPGVESRVPVAQHPDLTSIHQDSSNVEPSHSIKSSANTNSSKTTPVPPEEEIDRSLIEDLSKYLRVDVPGVQEKFQLLLSRVYHHEVSPEDIAELQKDVDVSNRQHKSLNPNLEANRIAVPKEDSDLKKKTDFCLQFIKDLKENGQPSGITLDHNHAKPSRFGKYREGEEYEKTTESLGEGNMSSGKIMVVKDKKTGSENAMKTVMIADFREDEIKCWIDLNETGLPPQLYMFYYDSVDNRVKFHMEALKTAKTLQEVIDEHMGILWNEHQSLVRPFSLCVLHDVLSAIETMTNKQWTHGDLHGGNLMLDHKMKLKVLDFGRARKLEANTGTVQGAGNQNFKSDITEAINKFTALYLSHEFYSRHEMETKWKEMLNDGRLSFDDRVELFNLMESALQIEYPSDIPEFKRSVEKLMQDQKREDIMREVAKVLFPYEYTESNLSTMDSPRGDAGRMDFLTMLRMRFSVG